MIRSYLRMFLFAFGLLAGVQVPGFLADYAQHVEARRLEITGALEGYQKTAVEFFGGDMQALITHYRSNSDPVFQRDADNLQYIVLRAHILEREWQAMQGPWYAQVWHILARADHRLLEEAWQAYDFLVLLKPAAIAWGLSCGILLALLVEMFWVLATWPLRREPRRASAHRRHRAS